MTKQSQLKKVAREINNCRTCQRGKLGMAVPGEGSPSAKIMFIGEAPGKSEAATGRPFVGRSGQLLRKLIRSCGIKEKDVFITSPVKYLPKKGTPSAKDIKHGKSHLQKQIDIIKPKVMVLLGNTACKAMLSDKYPVMSNHGRFINENGNNYFVTLHPAAVIRFPKYRPVINRDFKKLNKLV